MPTVISFVLFRREERISLSLDISGACIAQEFACFLGRVQRINKKKISIRPDPIILRESATPAAVRVLKNIILFINRMPNSARAGYAKILYFAGSEVSRNSIPAKAIRYTDANLSISGSWGVISRVMPKARVMTWMTVSTGSANAMTPRIR